MKNLYIVANWKANNTPEEAKVWLKWFKENLSELSGRIENKEIIICPTDPVLPTVKNYVTDYKLPFRIGSQDISMFGRGAHTGEVPGALLHDLVAFSIIGHSERRAMGETDEIVAKKTSDALSSSIIPIFCVQDENTPIASGAFIVAYEPVEAIGTGNPDTPKDANSVAGMIMQKNPGVKSVLYGGSVTSENVNSFTSEENISGVLVGGASLDAQKFSQIIKNA